MGNHDRKHKGLTPLEIAIALILLAMGMAICFPILESLFRSLGYN